MANHPGEVCPAKWKEGEATLAPRSICGQDLMMPVPPSGRGSRI